MLFYHHSYVFMHLLHWSIGKACTKCLSETQTLFFLNTVQKFIITCICFKLSLHLLPGVSFPFCCLPIAWWDGEGCTLDLTVQIFHQTHRRSHRMTWWHRRMHLQTKDRALIRCSFQMGNQVISSHVLPTLSHSFLVSVFFFPFCFSLFTWQDYSTEKKLDYNLHNLKVTT